MIRLGDSIGLDAFQLPGSLQATAASAAGSQGAVALGGDLLVLASGIGSDPGPAARGLSVAQHAANVLSHLCREAS